MSTATASATKAVRACAEPLVATVEENVRELRRAVVAGRHAAEDGAAEAVIQVRRHPFVSLSMAIGVGTLVGCLIGFTFGRFAHGSASR